MSADTIEEPDRVVIRASGMEAQRMLVAVAALSIIMSISAGVTVEDVAVIGAVVAGTAGSLLASRLTRQLIIDDAGFDDGIRAHGYIRWADVRSIGLARSHLVVTLADSSTVLARIGRRGSVRLPLLTDKPGDLRLPVDAMDRRPAEILEIVRAAREGRGIASFCVPRRAGAASRLWTFLRGV